MHISLKLTAPTGRQPGHPPTLVDQMPVVLQDIRPPFLTLLLLVLAGSDNFLLPVQIVATLTKPAVSVAEEGETELGLVL